MTWQQGTAVSIGISLIIIAAFLTASAAIGAFIYLIAWAIVSPVSWHDAFSAGFLITVLVTQVRLYLRYR